MINETLTTLKNRRSIRQFKPEQILAEDLQTVLEAGTFAPTGGGKQSPTIVAVQDPATVKQLDEMNAKVLNPKGGIHPYYGAPTIVLVLAPEGFITGVEDASLVAGNIMNAAYSIGLGSCWIHRANEMFASAEGKALLKKWGLSEKLHGVASIALGYQAGEQPTAAKRKEDYLVYIK